MNVLKNITLVVGVVIILAAVWVFITAYDFASIILRLCTWIKFCILTVKVKFSFPVNPDLKSY